MNDFRVPIVVGHRSLCYNPNASQICMIILHSSEIIYNVSAYIPRKAQFSQQYNTKPMKMIQKFFRRVLFSKNFVARS